MIIYSSRQAYVTLFISEEIGIRAKYSDFSNNFSLNSAVELSEHLGINNHFINLLDNKQPLYGPIYSLGPIELQMLKIYIEANLASSFIRLSKSFISAPILFVRKKNSSFCLCVNYRGLNNLTIKNCYSLSLISKSFDCLGCIKSFT